MEYRYSLSNNGLMGQELAYDLRQFYAKIVGQHLEDVAEARKADRYDIWLKALEDLHVVVRHRFKKKEDDESDYNKLIQNVVDLANKNRNVFLGQTKEDQACADIERALRDIEMFLYEHMDLNNMFGSNKSVPGL